MNTTVHLIEELRKALSAATDIKSVLAAAGVIAVRQSSAETVYLHLPDSEPVGLADGVPASNPLGLNFKPGGLFLNDAPLSLPLFVSDIGKARIDEELLHVLTLHGVKSIALVPVYSGGQLCAVMEFRFVKNFHRWGRDDSLLLQQIAEYSGIHIDRLRGGDDRYAKALAHDSEGLVDELLKQYQRLARFGNLIIVRTDRNLVVTDILGETENILGFSQQELMHDRSVWLRFVHPGDLRRLLSKSSRREPVEINEEIRVINHRTGLTHWLMLRAVPRFSPGKQFLGWEGFGVDITDKHTAQEELIAERKRIEALYTVSRVLQNSADPSIVMLKGLKALVGATRSDGGVGFFPEQHGRGLEVVAAEGLESDALDALGKNGTLKELVQNVLQHKKGMLIDDLQSSAGPSDAARREGVRSTIILPLVFEDGVLGVLVLFRRRATRYSAADFDLVGAASSQIALAAREAELFAAERRQASSLAALYRLTHTLSQQVSLKEVIQHAFPVIQEELACKRMWLGVMSERGTHIVGQAGVGPGIRQHLVDLQIDLTNRHDYLDEALRTRQPVVVQAGATFDCSEMNRVVQALQLSTFIIVPLVAIGQVVGVLIVEPTAASTFMAQRKLPLLNSMASEIAPVILARLLESRMADADKMRMAGLLASGVAHNFNNLLQAVMGQASLIEMQSAPDSKIADSARLINEAASKGANLVKQLFSLSAKNTFLPSPVSLESMVRDSEDVYRSVLGSSITLSMQIEPETGEVLGDYASIQQVVTNLLVNSREAIGDGLGHVKIAVQKVRLRSGEIHPELAPGLYLRVDVEDDGPGMDPESLSRCFEPFYTTKNVDARTGLGLGGSGLGLSTAYWIMKRHDGIIAARSQPGMGATFSLYFPAMTVRAGERGASQADIPVAQPAQKEEELAEDSAEAEGSGAN